MPPTFSDHNYDRRTESFRLTDVYLLQHLLLFAIFMACSIKVLVKYRGALSVSSRRFVGSFFIGLLFKLVCFGTTRVVIGGTRIANQKDFDIYHACLFITYAIDLFLYLIFAYAIVNMIKARAVINHTYPA